MIINGTAHWCKIVGAPSWGYKKQYKEWSMDLSINAATKKTLLDNGCDPSVFKNKDDDRGDFITFKRRETKKDGSPGKPIAVFDSKGRDWDGKTLIGNGSQVNVKIALNPMEGERYSKPGLIKVQVVELVPFEGRAGDDEDFPVYKDGEVEKWD